MEALFELASLFQVIPKPSWLPGREAEAGKRGWEKDCSPPFSNCGIMFGNNHGSS